MGENQEPKKKMSLGKKLLIGAGVLVVIGVVANIGKSKTADGAVSTEQVAESEKAAVAVGGVLKTSYFDIVANKVELLDHVDTGNQFADLKAEPGNMYLVINATFKNTDKESRMLVDGSVWINYNGKDYEFDKSETIMLDGWSVALKKLNPLTTLTTNLVYKIPAEIKGKTYWQPGRSGKEERIFLGEL